MKILDKATAYLNLIRFFKPTGTLLLLYPLIFSFLFADPNFYYFDLLLIFIGGAFIMRSSGCIINDLCDIKIDAQVERTKSRPLAAGIISKFEAYFILLIFLSIGSYLLFLLGSDILKIGSWFIVPITIYPLTKRFFKYPQIFLGFTFNLGIFLVYFAIDGKIGFEAILLYLSCVCWTIGYDTIYAFSDIQDDKKIGVNSTAISFGKYAKNIILLCYALFFIGILAIGLHKEYGFLYFILMQITSLYFLAKLWKSDFADYAKELFIFNNKIALFLIILILGFSVL